MDPEISNDLEYLKEQYQTKPGNLTTNFARSLLLYRNAHHRRLDVPADGIGLLDQDDMETLFNSLQSQYRSSANVEEYRNQMTRDMAAMAAVGIAKADKKVMEKHVPEELHKPLETFSEALSKVTAQRQQDLPENRIKVLDAVLNEFPEGLRVGQVIDRTIAAHKISRNVIFGEDQRYTYSINEKNHVKAYLNSDEVPVNPVEPRFFDTEGKPLRRSDVLANRELGNDQNVNVTNHLTEQDVFQIFKSYHNAKREANLHVRAWQPDQAVREDSINSQATSEERPTQRRRIMQDDDNIRQMPGPSRQANYENALDERIRGQRSRDF
ncbi:MAG: hypothetical protein AAGA53_02355 [Pseudomonadota bacterium]